MDKNLKIQESIFRAINGLSLVQQIKWLDFINSLIEKKEQISNKNSLLKFAGAFDVKDLREMEEAIKDC